MFDTSAIGSLQFRIIDVADFDLAGSQIYNASVTAHILSPPKFELIVEVEFDLEKWTGPAFENAPPGLTQFLRYASISTGDVGREQQART
ncbi:hypothetical protein [Mesorhizobium sp. B2-7-3]|uniref:hypothetical protein n=1 Tax=Mesorhizobium sp. B2-7-3 TaxID=2589907 RepID=UPI0015E282AC|nr:hypothetical protein [Mesorhizobium sp. B2-7-3]